MVRPKIGTNERLFVEYYEAGYNDCQIAEYMGISRMTVARKRGELGLDANSRRGDRGMGVREDEDYWRFVTRVYSRNKELARVIRQISARLYSNGHIDYFTYFLCMGTEPVLIKPAMQRSYWRGPSKMNICYLERIVEYEQRMDQNTLVGVPGPAFIQLVKVFKNASEEHIRVLGEEAVKGAGFVNTYTKLVQNFECIPAAAYEAFWAGIKQGVGQWWIAHQELYSEESTPGTTEHSHQQLPESGHLLSRAPAYAG